jgi:hypothetical protein
MKTIARRYILGPSQICELFLERVPFFSNRLSAGAPSTFHLHFLYMRFSRGPNYLPSAYP